MVAWSAIPESDNSRNAAANEVTREAEDFLGPLLLKQTRNAFHIFHRDITLPAVELAGTMRQSTSSYKFVFLVDRGDHGVKRPTLPPLGHGGHVSIGDFNQSDVLDVESSRILKASRLEVNEDGSIGRRIMTIHPGVCRRGRDEDILVSKELVLVELTKPMQRRGKPREVESSKGMLGGLFNFS